MKYELYGELKITDDFSIIDFKSVGKHGSIPKRIVFAATELNDVYNLAFGDIEEGGEIDDYNISDNGDRNKILATIANVVKIYTEKYPDRFVIFRGSTTERTRLYRIAISINLEELSSYFSIYGLVNNSIIPFNKNMDIDAFLIQRKKI